ncbi:MAG: hypothetical protein J7K23_01210 [Thermoproteales archaeon]|nr:hypothetical protein [Thermoproteales archaeon]
MTSLGRVIIYIAIIFGTHVKAFIFLVIVFLLMTIFFEGDIRKYPLGM